VQIQYTLNFGRSTGRGKKCVIYPDKCETHTVMSQIALHALHSIITALTVTNTKKGQSYLRTRKIPDRKHHRMNKT
jgi:hypothetical protein